MSNQKLKSSLSKKIILSLTVSVIIVFLSLNLIMDLYLNIYDPDWRGIIQDKEIKEKDKLFIIGSSSVYPINSTHITEFLETNGFDYSTYNLADMSDSPSHRLKSIDHLISLKPKIVAYGIGILDFNQKSILKENTVDSKKISDQIDIKQNLGKMISEYSGIDIFEKNPVSPKDKILLSLKYIIKGPEYIHHPFINYHLTDISSEKDLGSYKTKIDFKGIEPLERNNEKIALEKIIEKLNKNDIHVLLFIVPYHDVFLNNISLEDKKNFENILNEIEKNQNIKIISLQNEYSKLNIWRDLIHVAVNTKSSIYSEDIAKIILMELQS